MNCDTNTFKFIRQHQTDDPLELLLHAQRYKDVDIRYAAQQIEGIQQALDKWPTLARYEAVVYPPKINREQSSSEATAQYKATQFVTPGQKVADLTGGMGIDTMAFASIGASIDYCEQNAELASIAQSNFAALGLVNIHVHTVDSIRWLEQNETRYDIIYIDPARRDINGKKVAAFEECTPNLLEHLAMIKERCSTLIVKSSPMIDIATAKKELGRPVETHIIGIKNECKEVLFVLGGNASDRIVCTDLSDGLPPFIFTEADEQAANCRYARQTETYLCEPNATIMKGGGYKYLGQAHNLAKLGRNTHLYFSENKPEGFPGRVFLVEQEIALTAQAVQKAIPQKEAHIVSRNYPVKAPDLMRQLKMKEGGSKYIVATTLSDKKIGLLCSRIK